MFLVSVQQPTTTVVTMSLLLPLAKPAVTSLLDATILLKANNSGFLFTHTRARNGNPFTSQLDLVDIAK